VIRLEGARRDSRRREILDAALACFSELGYQQTTIEHIRARSGASTGSIYHHFGGKEQLAAALYLDGLASYQDGLVAELERRKSAERGVRAIVAYHLDWIAEHQALARFLLSMRHTEGVAATEAEIRRRRTDFFRRALAWLEPHIAAGAIRPLPAPLLVALIIGPAQELGRHWLGRPDDPEQGRALRDARRILADAAWNAIRRTT
jgi:AcrR family transcriptional regulator